MIPHQSGPLRLPLSALLTLPPWQCLLLLDHTAKLWGLAEVLSSWDPQTSLPFLFLPNLTVLPHQLHSSRDLLGEPLCPGHKSLLGNESLQTGISPVTYLAWGDFRRLLEGGGGQRKVEIQRGGKVFYSQKII